MPARACARVHRDPAPAALVLRGPCPALRTIGSTYSAEPSISASRQPTAASPRLPRDRVGGIHLSAEHARRAPRALRAAPRGRYRRVRRVARCVPRSADRQARGRAPTLAHLGEPPRRTLTTGAHGGCSYRRCVPATKPRPPAAKPAHSPPRTPPSGRRTDCHRLSSLTSTYRISIIRIAFRSCSASRVSEPDDIRPS